MAFSFDQLVSLAAQAGLSADKAVIAAAIAMAESSGNPNAHNPRPPDDSYGLWQINMLGKLGPERRAQLGLSRNQDLFDPATNARAMVMISSGGTNWRPWTTYTSGAYRRYLPAGGATSGGSPLPPSPNFGDMPTWVWVAIGVGLIFLVKR